MLAEVPGGGMSVPFSVQGYPEWEGPHPEVPEVLSCPGTAVPLWPRSPSVCGARGCWLGRGMSPRVPLGAVGTSGCPRQQLPLPSRLSP